MAVGAVAVTALALLLAPAPAGAVVDAAGPSAVPTRVVRACVRKSSGRIRIVSAGPCRRGERLVVWNRRGSAGPIGAVGPVGPAGGTIRVTDGTGVVVPGVVYTDGSRVGVLVTDGIYNYNLDGRVAVEEDFPRYWVGAGCSGTAFVPFVMPSFSAGGPLRFVLPNTDGVTTSAYRFGVTMTVTAGTVVSAYGGSPPACMGLLVPTDTPVQTLVLLGPPPPDLPGPLTITLT